MCVGLNVCKVTIDALTLTSQLPAFLMRQWAEAPEHTDLGSIRIETNATSQQGKTTPIVTLHLRETAETAQFPKNYQLQFKNSPPGNMLVFTERTEDASLAQSIEGWVQHECNVQPVMDDSYRNMLRARRVEAERPKRTTQAIEVTGQSRLITLEKQSLQIGQTSEFKVMPKVLLIVAAYHSCMLVASHSRHFSKHCTETAQRGPST